MPGCQDSRGVRGFFGKDWRGPQSNLSDADSWSNKNLRAPELTHMAAGPGVVVVGTVGLLTAGAPTLALAWQFSCMTALIGIGAATEASTTVDAILRTARVSLGVVVFAAVEEWLCNNFEQRGILSASFATHVFLSFGGSCISDYVCHRFVWHGSWSTRVRGQRARVLSSFVRGHHVQHHLAHHKHALNPKADADYYRLMRPLPVEFKEAIEQPFAQKGDALALHAFSASDHGMTMRSHLGVCAYLVCYALMPTCTLALWNHARGCGSASALGHLAVWLHLLSACVPSFFLLHHDQIHASPKVRKARAEARGGILASMWSSSEFDRLAAGHMRHHFDPLASDRFYGLVPYGRLFIVFVDSRAEDGFESDKKLAHLSDAQRSKLAPWLATRAK